MTKSTLVYSRKEKPMQQEIDAKNAVFWNELCGSGLARHIGITEITPESIKLYDKAYMGVYPYLEKYVTSADLKGKRVLDIGLGYGTLGQFIDSMGCDYYGLDIAEGPVAMMTDRLKLAGRETEGRVQVGSALNIPYADGYFDYVYSDSNDHGSELSNNIKCSHKNLLFQKI